MTEQKQAFDKRELKSLFRELLKPYATMIPEIGNQDNAFNDAIPYLHRIFSGNDGCDWELQDLFYDFEDQIDEATDKATESRHVFVLLIKLYILLEYMNYPYRLSLKNPFGSMCGKIDCFASKVKQRCIDNEVDMDFMEFMEKVYEEEDPTYSYWGFSQLIGQKIVNLPYWDTNRYHLLTVPYKPEVGQSAEVSPNSKSAGEVQINSNTERAELLSTINDLKNEIKSLKDENEKLKSQIDDLLNEPKAENTNEWQLNVKVRCAFVLKMFKMICGEIADKQAAAILCAILTGYDAPNYLYNHIGAMEADMISGNKSLMEDVDKLNAVVVHGLKAEKLIIKKSDKKSNEEDVPDREVYSELVGVMIPRRR